VTTLTPFTQGRSIAAHLAGVLAGITKANGYKTDIGLRVYRGRRKIDDTLVPCGVLIEGEDRPGENVGRDTLKIVQSYVLGGYAPCDPDHPNDTAHDIISDIKKAVFSHPDGRLGGRSNKVRYVGRDIGPRTDGVAIVFAVVHIEVDFAETLSDA
jgi:hypothetical protein